MSHKYGQVFLKDRNIIDKIIMAAHITPETHVLEIGSGQGWLSLNLAKLSKKLTIVELDPTYIEETQNRLAKFNHIQIINADILKMDLGHLHPAPFKIVTNLPYYISAKFIQKVIENRSLIENAIIMVQKEFAQKLIAKPGSKHYCSLGVYANFYAQIRNCFSVSKNCFRPIPGVDSAVIDIIPRKKPLFDVDEKLFFNIIKSAFWGRRKTLASCLKKSPHLSLNPEKLSILPYLLENPTVRGETLSLDDFHKLYLQITK